MDYDNTQTKDVAAEPEVKFQGRRRRSRQISIFDYAEDLLLIACRRVRRLEPYSRVSLAVGWQQHHGRSL